MKFSYTFLKKLVPGVKDKEEMINLLTTHSFETEDGGGNILDMDLPANRYSDASSHWGVARELAVARGGEFEPPLRYEVPGGKIDVKIEDSLCLRYTACVMENVKVGESPDWIKEILEECGLRPINNIVDVMNYVMLETSQPLHAFDLDKLEGGKIRVRRARKGEKITTIDMQEFDLDSEVLVIADASNPVAIAGVKGGHGPEVSGETTRILIEAAAFDSRQIYKTARKIRLDTDASNRFSHDLSLALPAAGLLRAVEMVKEVSGGARETDWYDSLSEPVPKRFVRADADRIKNLLGVEVSSEDVEKSLRRLGFSAVEGEENLWEIPVLRIDIESGEDLAEEIARVIGYDKLPSIPPKIQIRAAEENETVVFKEKVRNLLVGQGMSEIYTHSFYAGSDALGSEVELENPPSEEYKLLRESLVPGVLKSLEMNSKFRESVSVFEVGRVFWQEKKDKRERTNLCVALSSEEENFFVLKGMADSLLEAVGLVDYVFAEEVERSDAPLTEVADVHFENKVFLESEGKLIGYLGNTEKEGRNISILEVDMDALLSLVEGERGYRPVSKYPSVMRDISVLVPVSVRIGSVIREIQEGNTEIIRDVDLVDEYADDSWNGKQSITLRVVFQSDERTLENKEVDAEMEKIRKMLEKKFKAEVR